MEKLQSEKKDALNSSVVEIAEKLQHFEIELKSAKEDHGKLKQEQQKQKEQLSDSILELAEEEEVALEFKDLNFCKRVVYLDQSWVLLNKGAAYYWVNIKNVPKQKLAEFEKLEPI